MPDVFLSVLLVVVVSLGAVAGFRMWVLVETSLGDLGCGGVDTL